MPDKNDPDITQGEADIVEALIYSSSHLHGEVRLKSVSTDV